MKLKGWAVVERGNESMMQLLKEKNGRGVEYDVTGVVLYGTEEAAELVRSEAWAAGITDVMVVKAELTLAL